MPRVLTVLQDPSRCLLGMAKTYLIMGLGYFGNPAEVFASAQFSTNILCRILGLTIIIICFDFIDDQACDFPNQQTHLPFG